MGGKAELLVVAGFDWVPKGVGAFVDIGGKAELLPEGLLSVGFD